MAKELKNLNDGRQGETFFEFDANVPQTIQNSDALTCLENMLYIKLSDMYGNYSLDKACRKDGAKCKSLLRDAKKLPNLRVFAQGISASPIREILKQKMKSRKSQLDILAKKRKKEEDNKDKSSVKISKMEIQACKLEYACIGNRMNLGKVHFSRTDNSVETMEIMDKDMAPTNVPLLEY